MSQFLQELEKAPVLADGAMGSYLFGRTGRLSETNHVYEAFNLDMPELVHEVHLAYLRAGARCIKTNTFGANRVHLKEVGEQDRLAFINRAGVAEARRARDLVTEKAGDNYSRYILGSIGPPLETRDSDMPLAETYLEQLEILIEEGVDALLIETFYKLDELLELVDVESGLLLCGFAFFDCRMDDARFVLEVVDGAYRSGATAVNRAMARELLVEDGRVVGAGVEDRESGMTLEVRAMTTVCCAGPWTSGLSASAGSAPVVATRLTKGVHLVLPGLASDDALVINSNDDARIVFLIPWYGRTLLGTTDTDHAGDPGDARVEAADVAYLLERVNRTLRKPRWTEADVIASFAGLRTLPVTSDSHPSNVTREWRLAEPMDGLLVPVGGKYTSARADAAAIVDRVLIRAGWPVRASPTEDRPFPWCPAEPFDAWAVDQVSEAVSLGLDPVTAHTCTLRHGTRVARILELVRDNPDLARRIVPDAPFCRAEIVHAAREEMARSLDDVLRRRIPLILLSRLDAETVCEIAALAAEHLGWNDARCREEAASVISSRRRQDTAP